MRLANKTRTILAAVAFAAFALIAATPSAAQEAKLPTTAAEHEALAKQYREQAAQYKKVADDHRAMATTAAARAHSASKGGGISTGDKLQKHCETIAKDADKLATDVEKAADYHTLRAKELQGK